MRKVKLLALAMLGLAIAAVAIGLFGTNGSAPPDAAGPEKPFLAQQFRGISLQLSHPREDIPYEKYIDEIAATGANAICLSLAGFQENCSSTNIFVNSRKICPDKRVTSLIAYAHSKGLRVVIMPIVLLENPRKGEWRGKIAPKNWDDWWENYTNFIMHYMWLAAEGKAEMFIIGSELKSTEDQTDQWRALIARIRKHYGGFLSYSANWNHYEGIKWWRDLDVIGMNSYHELTYGGKPTVERLLDAWKPIKKDILTWRAKIKLPILFTEVASPSQETGARYPWNYHISPERPDPVVQANCFEAFFRTWSAEKDVAGFLVWEWRNHPARKIGPKDASYLPCGKPAMKVICRYLSTPDTKGKIKPASGPTSAPVSAPDTRRPASDPKGKVRQPVFPP